MYNVYKIREDFPIFKNRKTIYLDNAATTYKPQIVIDEVTKYLSIETANSGRGDYHDAYLVDKKIEDTRKLVKEFINASDEDEIIFTQGTTMSINLLATSYAAKVLKPGDEILLSIAEHASNTLPWFDVAKVVGAKVVFMPLSDKGLITVENLKKHLTKRTKIVAVTHISNVLGYINDIKALAKVVHDNGAVIIVDGAQSVPHLKTDVKDLDVDFLAFSGHKMLAPTGIGVLYGKKELLAIMNHHFTGGGMNSSYTTKGEIQYMKVPHKFEAGTLNIEGIYGLHGAITYINKLGIDNIIEHELKLRKYAIAALKEVPHITIYNEDAKTGIITFNVKGVYAQDAATYFSSRNIALRSGQHCAKLLKHYLNEMATIRASIYLYTTKEDIDAFISAAKTAEDFLDAYF